MQKIKSETISLRLYVGMKERLLEMANEEHRSPSNFIQVAILKALEELERGMEISVRESQLQPHGSRKSAAINFRLDKSLKARLEHIARKNQRPVTSYIEMAILRAISGKKIPE